MILFKGSHATSLSLSVTNAANFFTSNFVFVQSSMDHPTLKEQLTPIRTLYEDVRRKALMRLEYEGLHKAEAITTKGARY